MIIEPPNPKADRRYLGAHGKHGNLAERDANVIPLIDVVFILILYFMRSEERRVGKECA